MDLTLRKSNRMQLSKLVNKAKDLMQAEFDNDIADEVEVLIARIKAVQVNLDNLNEKVAPTIGDDQLQAECEKILEYNDLAVETIARLQQYRKKLTPSDAVGSSSTPPPNQEPVPQTPDGNTQRIQGHYSVRLPKLEISKFDGDFALWPSFWEQYGQAIHDNDNLNDAAKFAYLKSYLTGRAAITISGLTSSQASYNDAVELLKAEYSNSERTIDAYIQKLLSIAPVKLDRDVSSLRKLFNTASTITRSLLTLGISADQYGLLVKSILLKALPYKMRVAFNKQKLYNSGANEMSSASGTSDGAGSVDYNKQISDLLRFIKIEIDSHEQVQDVTGRDERNRDGSVKLGHKHFDQHKERTLGCTAAGLLTEVKDCCLFCKSQTHTTMECTGSLSISDKKDILKQNRRCFRCTKPNHSSKFCRVRNVRCTKCKLRHATSMCDPRTSASENASSMDVNVVSSSKPIIKGPSTSLLANGRIDNVYLQTACAYLTSNDIHHRMLIRLVVDGGSQLTFIKESLSRQLGMPVIGTHRISIQSFGKESRAPARLCNRVRIGVKSRYNDKVIRIDALEVPEICFDSLRPPSLEENEIREFASKFELADSNIDQVQVDGIALLVGADNYWKIITGETKRLSTNLMAVNSIFGWTMHGSSSSDADRYNFIANLNMTTVLSVKVTCEDVDLRTFCNLETLGINVNERTTSNFTQSFLKNKVAFKNGRYEVKLPWKGEQNLDSNCSGAMVRVKNLTSKLLRNGKLNEYDRAVRAYVEDNCAELAPANTNNARIYYMPHRPVYREDKDTTKLRVVFDASARAPGCTSLNEHLYAGDNLVPDLLGILINFRIGLIGLVADIEKAFLQISIAEEDRNAHCFLWYVKPIQDNLLTASDLPHLCTYRMKRVTFGVTTSPFLLAATLKKHLSNQQEQYKQTADKLLGAFYVDDLVISLSSLNEATELYEQSRQILSLANMNLRKWRSNNVTMMKRFLEDEASTVNKNGKVLGVSWYTVTDDLAVDLAILNDDKDKLPTKRNVLRTIAKIFDPLGMLGPFTIRAKILLQNVWKEKLEWDAVLTEGLKSDWFKWLAEVSTLSTFRVPRCVLTKGTNEVELHLFADASPRAYGVVAYIRCLKNNVCNYLISKTRVSPINEKGSKELTLPKLELTAALCAARLQSFILEKTKLNVKDIVFWSDSKITLYWIRGRSSRWKPYVQNRVEEIQKLSKGPWRYCPGKENPAYLITKGVTAKVLTESVLWLKGPDWLMNAPGQWPIDEYHDFVEPGISSLLVTSEKIRLLESEPIFELEKYSGFEKILRITAYVHRFLNNLNKSKERLFGYLTPVELRKAEKYWLKFVQQNEFPDEVAALSHGKTLNSTSSILSLNPFLDSDAVLRVGGRLEEAPLPYETRHPALLPKRSLLTEKIIWHSHDKTHHSGVNATLAVTRQKYWIIQGRQRIKAIIRCCLKCKRLKGKPGNEPFAPLPRSRITMANPFKVTGVDFAGPLYVKNGDQKVKSYIMLFTCAVIRAVHLELVPDLTTESCIQGFRKFIARRGVPDVVYSDNAKTLRRAAYELQELSAVLRSSQFQERVQKYRIEWRFIVERAAWWGGFWERMVRTVKDALKITLGKALITYEELQTVLAEVEATVNSRPLTYISDDQNNLLNLSPSHFLIGSTDVGFSIDLKRPDFKRNDILKQWKFREHLIAKFWNRWCTDYLQQLRSAHHTNRAKSTRFKKGDVVLLHDQYIPRLQWKMARIIDVYHGRDGKVRACEIQTSNGARLRRPVQHLFPLEVDCISSGEDVENKKNE